MNKVVKIKLRCILLSMNLVSDNSESRVVQVEPGWYLTVGDDVDVSYPWCI